MMHHDESLWFEDGNTIIEIDDVMFKVHLDSLAPLSSIFSAIRCSQSLDGLPLLSLERDIANGKDVAALLHYIYHPEPLRTFAQTARVLRAATQFDFGSAREMALDHLRSLYPPAPAPFMYSTWERLHEAAELALDCAVPRDILRGLLYGIVTTSEFDVDVEQHTEDSLPSLPVDTCNGTCDDTRGQALSPSTTRLCVRLMQSIIDHFTPVLFTVPTSSHMECTGVFADHWMAYAIQPAIEEGGVYKPLETLQRISKVEWATLGLCDACCEEKKKEWADEAEDIWERMDKWIGVT